MKKIISLSFLHFFFAFFQHLICQMKEKKDVQRYGRKGWKNNNNSGRLLKILIKKMFIKKKEKKNFLVAALLVFRFRWRKIVLIHLIHPPPQGRKPGEGSEFQYLIFCLKFALENTLSSLFSLNLVSI